MDRTDGFSCLFGPSCFSPLLVRLIKRRMVPSRDPTANVLSSGKTARHWKMFVPPSQTNLCSPVERSQILTVRSQPAEKRVRLTAAGYEGGATAPCSEKSARGDIE